MHKSAPKEVLALQIETSVSQVLSPSSLTLSGSYTAGADFEDILHRGHQSPQHVILEHHPQGKAIPLKALTVESLPVKTLLAEALPVETLPAKAVPVKALPVKALPV